MAHRRSWLATLTAALAAVTLSATPAAADPTPTAATCGTTWGSLPKSSAGAPDNGSLTGVRSGRHDCYDRLVFDIRGAHVRDYSIGYADSFEDIAGNPVTVRGGAGLFLHVDASAYDLDTGDLLFDPPNPAEVVAVDGYRTFRQLHSLGGRVPYTTFALGVRARLPFRALTIDDGSTTRLVIDVAHTW
ncbi:hypothetical protein JOD54_000314 [Actinokineospora baliensis]|uniref:AMIN-like domain-containing (lipo)protein n=1 Tax=Actinokineospora baliensis TaxID=547056 RepID=UPI00195895BE|nr:hypothetical protein [Actinokineospora baliensis]MBM7770110.1 hypothetical protein [Actinokineospora baliensis]